jgi:hypothetical protein
VSKNWAEKIFARNEHELPKMKPEIMIQISQHRIKRGKNEQYTRDPKADFFHSNPNKIATLKHRGHRPPSLI